jgi:hypothetical protein
MAKIYLIKFFNYYPTKATKGFTVYEIAKFNKVTVNAARNAIWRGIKNGNIKVLIPSRGKGRGKGKTIAVYALTEKGKRYFKLIAPTLMI